MGWWVGSLHALQDTTVNITSFTFFLLSSNLEQTSLQYHDLEESQSDAQPDECIGKTFVQPRDQEQWPFTHCLYFNVSLPLPLSASSEMGPEQPSHLLPCSWTTVVLQHVVPGLVSRGLSFTWLPPHQQTHGLPGFSRSHFHGCDFHGCLCWDSHMATRATAWFMCYQLLIVL